MLVWFGAAKRHCSFFPGAVLASFGRAEGLLHQQGHRPLPARPPPPRHPRAEAGEGPHREDRRHVIVIGRTMPKKPARKSRTRPAAKQPRRTAPSTRPRRSTCRRAVSTAGSPTRTSPAATPRRPRRGAPRSSAGSSSRPSPRPPATITCSPTPPRAAAGSAPATRARRPAVSPMSTSRTRRPLSTPPSAPAPRAVHPPERVMEGVTVAIVRAPGGVVIGFSGP